jgi:sulfite exporter TauE/SafE
MTNILISFITGLTTGGLSCFALQGGLFSSLLLSTKSSAVAKTYALVSFLGSKLLAYSLLGLILGLAGNFFTPSPKLSGVLNLLIAGFMIGVALEALKVHPIFRYFIIQPPKFVRKLIKDNSKKEGLLNGAVLGASTVFIPCGITQAMMALAISSQSPLIGMSTMFAFILGTIPMFLVLGLTATKLNEKYSQLMSKIIAVVLLILACYTIFYSVRLLGYNIGAVKNTGQTEKQEVLTETSSTDQLQTLSLFLTDQGYVPQRFIIKKGIPVELTIKNEEARGCIQGFVVPDLNIRKVVRLGKSEKVTFTPQKAGKISFTCSMGMYYGEFIVQ